MVVLRRRTSDSSARMPEMCASWLNLCRAASRMPDRYIACVSQVGHSVRLLLSDPLVFVFRVSREPPAVPLVMHIVERDGHLYPFQINIFIFPFLEPSQVLQVGLPLHFEEAHEDGGHRQPAFLFGRHSGKVQDHGGVFAGADANAGVLELVVDPPYAIQGFLKDVLGEVVSLV